MADSQSENEVSERLQRWNQRWHSNNIAWHKTSPHPFLLKYGHLLIPNFQIDSGICHESVTKVRVFVPLCGKSVDMAFLAQHPGNGVEEVVGVDGIRKALEEFAIEHPDLMIEKVHTFNDENEHFVGSSISLLKRDLFDVNHEITGGKFDVVLDRGSIVAIQPELREAYVNLIGNLLKPGGKILLITVDRRSGTDEGRKAGPPFSLDSEEIHRLFGSLTWTDSISKLDEYDEFIDEESKSKWTSQGVQSMYELVHIIQKKV